MKKIIKVILLSVIIITVCKCAYVAYNNELNPKINYSGVIVSKLNGTEDIKHGSVTKFYLNIKTDSGYKVITVGATSYFNKQIGDNYYWSERSQSNGYVLSSWIVLITSAIMIVSFLLVHGLCWLFDLY